MPEYIEREALLSKFNIDDMMNVNGTLILLNDARKAIKDAPSADVAPVRHGRWLPTTKWWQGGSAWKQCSECGILHLGKSNFCPNCGADMRGSNDE